MSIGIPIKLFHEARNHVVNIELKTGETYRGHLVEMDDTMNAVLENVQKTSSNG
jgi:small nuclear ribonucleoprotein D3